LPLDYAASSLPMYARLQSMCSAIADALTVAAWRIADGRRVWRRTIHHC
jgi:hypothetical protein